VLAYRRFVDEAVLARLGDPETHATVELGIHHEQQHQELILTDIKHALASNPLEPAYRGAPPPPRGRAAPLRWRAHEAGVRSIGHAGPGFAFDNERPRHRVFAEAFELATRPVTNAEYREFIADGGYRRPELWLSDGWAAAQREAWSAPLYWRGESGDASCFGLDGRQPLRPEDPVCHVSWFEADAFARWAGARLPTEAEWETAADAEIEGNFVETGWLAPRPTPDLGERPAALFGDVWEWTASPYVPYPGFQPLAGALGEYNGKFMSGQLVLRGGSCATPRSHVRRTYRNFFYPHQRWQWSGIRLAR
jgi:ergothioneine biosynthesis protein EgtB